MVTEDNESCASGVVESSASKTRQETKTDVYNEVLRCLKQADHPEAREPDFDDQLWAHFNRLPSRYAMDVNSERPEDVLMHKQFLHLATDPDNRQVVRARDVNQEIPFIPLQHEGKAFGSSPNLEALAVEASKLEDGDDAVDAGVKFVRYILRKVEPYTLVLEWCVGGHPIEGSNISGEGNGFWSFLWILQLTSLLAELGLNIREAHVFSPNDGYSLDVFVVDGWLFEEVDKLWMALEKKF